MAPDYKTLLLAIGLSGMCLAATLFASWLSARVERFLLGWSLGVACIVLAVATYGFYVERPEPLLGCVYFALQFAGFAFIYGAAYRFRTARSARSRIVLVFALCTAPSVPFLLAGLSGVAFIGDTEVRAHLPAGDRLVVLPCHRQHGTL